MSYKLMYNYTKFGFNNKIATVMQTSGELWDELHEQLVRYISQKYK